MSRKSESNRKREAFLNRIKASFGLVELNDEVEKFRESNPSGDPLKDGKFNARIEEIVNYVTKYKQVKRSPRKR
jgi:hypothetical protein